MKKNPAQGLKWLTAAARKRHPTAQAVLGDLYWSGRYVNKSETRGLMWYILAHETAKPEENPEVINRYNELMSIADESMRLEAVARARRWSEQFPRAAITRRQIWAERLALSEYRQPRPQAQRRTPTPTSPA